MVSCRLFSTNQSGDLEGTSFTVFKDVISRLASSSDDIPYSNSKFTEDVQSLLNGKSLLSLICTFNTDMESVQETSNLLEFANTAKQIAIYPVVNVIQEDQSMSRFYKRQLEDLRCVCRLPVIMVFKKRFG